MEKVKPSSVCDEVKNFNLCDVSKYKNFNLPLSEKQIIELQKMLMTPQQHNIYTHDVASGRALLNTMLQSLSYYNNIGYVTTKNILHQQYMIDILSILQKDTQSYDLWHAIDLFFINNPNVDFIWVELTKELLNIMGTNSLTYFCQLLTSHQAIPVIILQYETH
ncbi:hypothetical protein KBD08_04090 [Candidatus Babeliales bacterium]|nr:hypothetical protein [Candidatus Babeliales bacterium]